MSCPKRQPSSRPTAVTGRLLGTSACAGFLLIAWPGRRKTGPTATLTQEVAPVEVGLEVTGSAACRVRRNRRAWLRLASVPIVTASVTMVAFTAMTFAKLTATGPAAQGQVTTGTVNLVLSPSGSFSGAFANMAPGDVEQQTVTLSSSSTLAAASVKLTTSLTSGSTVLFDPAAGSNPSGDGLTLAIDNCAVPWTGTSPNLTCASSSSVLAVASPIKETSATLNNLTVVGTGSHTDNLRFTVTLPAAGGDNANQSKTATINFALTATQRASTQN